MNRKKYKLVVTDALVCSRNLDGILPVGGLLMFVDGSAMNVTSVGGTIVDKSVVGATLIALKVVHAVDLVGDMLMKVEHAVPCDVSAMVGSTCLKVRLLLMGILCLRLLELDKGGLHGFACPACYVP